MNFLKKQKKMEFDLMVARNDFSSEDLHENLQTTFNPIYKIIFTDNKDNQYQEYLEKALTEFDEVKRFLIYKDIGMDVLKKGYIVPLVYNKIIFYHHENVDISSWSNLFPELSLWKISVRM
jgi:hypothetical protein